MVINRSDYDGYFDKIDMLVTGMYRALKGYKPSADKQDDIHTLATIISREQDVMIAIQDLASILGHLDARVHYDLAVEAKIDKEGQT